MGSHERLGEAKSIHLWKTYNVMIQMRVLKNNNKELEKKSIVYFAFKNSFVVPTCYILDRRRKSILHLVRKKNTLKFRKYTPRLGHFLLSNVITN